jgi:hypothetical protein
VVVQTINANSDCSDPELDRDGEPVKTSKQIIPKVVVLFKEKSD